MGGREGCARQAGCARGGATRGAFHLASVAIPLSYYSTIRLYYFLLNYLLIHYYTHTLQASPSYFTTLPTILLYSHLTSLAIHAIALRALGRVGEEANGSGVDIILLY